MLVPIYVLICLLAYLPNMCIYIYIDIDIDVDMDIEIDTDIDIDIDTDIDKGIDICIYVYNSTFSLRFIHVMYILNPKP